MFYIPYNTNLKEFSRSLRNRATFGEILLWQKLKARGMPGYSFNRQKPLDNYIVDFYCHDLKLVIEVDGQYHNHETDYMNDVERQEILEKNGTEFSMF